MEGKAGLPKSALTEQQLAIFLKVHVAKTLWKLRMLTQVDVLRLHDHLRRYRHACSTLDPALVKKNLRHKTFPIDHDYPRSLVPSLGYLNHLRQYIPVHPSGGCLDSSRDHELEQSLHKPSSNVLWHIGYSLHPRSYNSHLAFATNLEATAFKQTEV